MDSFHEIATTHPSKMYIPSRWPTKDVLSTLVRKSSGQFIFAATVVKHISSNRHQPTRRLEIILGMQPSRNDRPFAELDDAMVLFNIGIWAFFLLLNLRGADSLLSLLQFNLTPP